MASNYTNVLKFENPAEYDKKWHVGWYRNQAINELMTNQQARGNYVNSGGELTYSAGLEIDIEAGSVQVGGVEYSFTAQTLSLTPGTSTVKQINFIYVSSVGALTVDIIPPGNVEYACIGMVDCNDLAVSLQNDMRIDAPTVSSLIPPAGVQLIGGISGLNFSNATSDLFNNISISPGTCFDSTGVKPILLPAAMVKNSSAAWIAGNNNGGMLSGSKATNNLYNIYAIRRDTDGYIDIGFLNQTLAIGSNLPAGYSHYRLIGFFLTETDSTNNMQFLQNGNYITFSSALGCGSINATSPTWFTFPATRIPDGADLLHLAFSGTGSYVEVSSTLSNEVGPDWFFNAPVGAIWPSSSGTDRSHWVMLPETKRLSVMTRAYPADVHVKSIQFKR